jgi:predicted RNase H-like HicB family nuclease
MADLQYSIDVAAAMPAGEKTIAQLDALAAQLVSAGVSADTLHDAVASVSNSLDAAKAATASAKAALAAGNAEMRELERTAKAAAKARDEAAKTGVVRPEVAAALDAANAAVVEHATTLDRLKASVKAASAEETQLAVTLRNAQQAAGAGTKALQEQERAQKEASAVALRNAQQAADAGTKALQEQERAQKAASAQQEKATKTAAELTGTEKWSKLQEAMGSTQGQTLLLGKGLMVAAGAAVAATLVVVALTAAFLAGVVAVAKWGVGLADARREAGLLAEASAALNPELASMRGLFDSVTAETGLATRKLEGLAQKLKDAGVPAGAMAGALRDAALAERALGDGGADPFIADIKAAKGAVTGLSNEVRGKLGVIVSKQVLGLSAQSEKLKTNVSGIFGGLDIEPFLASLQKLVGLFEEGSAAGEAMRFLFESMFQPLIDQAAKATTAIEAFALGFLIGATKLYIAVKPIVRSLAEFFGFDDPTTAETLDVAKSAGEALVPIVAGIAAAFGVLVAAGIALVGLALAPMILIAGLLVAAFYVVTKVVDVVSDAFNSVVAYLNGLIPGFGDLGSQIIQGMINGITGGASGVLTAITNVATGAIKAAKRALGIASPSKVFAELGGYTAEGFAEGVDDGAGDAQAAMTAMVEPPPPGEITAAALQAGGSSAAAASDGEAKGGAAQGPAAGGWSGNLVANFPNVTDAAGVKEALEELVTKIWAGDAAALGAEAV